MKSYKIQAKHLAPRLRLKDLVNFIPEKAHSESPIELVYKLGPESYIFIYHFGSIVAVNIQDEQLKEFVSYLSITSELTTANQEDFIVEEDPHLSSSASHEVGFNKLRIRQLTYPLMRLVAMIIAESTAIDYFENITEELLLKSRRISYNLKQAGRTQMSMHEMTKFVGDALDTKQVIIADLYIVDAPDETWDDQMMDRLYADLKRLFEIESRYKVLDFKLQLVHETTDVVMELLRFRRQTVLELIIIGLIAVEVVYFFLQVLIGK